MVVMEIRSLSPGSCGFRVLPARIVPSHTNRLFGFAASWSARQLMWSNSREALGFAAADG